MKSLGNLDDVTTARPLVADDLIELHAARLLLLFSICGKKGRIEGLTKMAKLDFFARYPSFFIRACAHLNVDQAIPTSDSDPSMVRFHYGPWDRRYYHVLAYLEARELITVGKRNKTFVFQVTATGSQMADQFSRDEAYVEMTDQFRQINRVLGQLKGTELKNLIYTVFEEEVTQKKLGEVIEP